MKKLEDYLKKELLINGKDCQILSVERFNEPEYNKIHVTFFFSSPVQKIGRTFDPSKEQELIEKLTVKGGKLT